MNLPNRPEAVRLAASNSNLSCLAVTMNLTCTIGLFLLLPVRFCQAQSAPAPATLTPGDNLVVQGIPAIPATTAERANRYTEFRGAAVFSWHPQRRAMLIGTRFADTIQVHEIKMPGGARTQLTFFPDRVTGALYQPHRGDYFLFSKDVGGGEWFQFYRFEVVSGKISHDRFGKGCSRSYLIAFAICLTAFSYRLVEAVRFFNPLSLVAQLLFSMLISAFVSLLLGLVRQPSLAGRPFPHPRPVIAV